MTTRAFFKVCLVLIFLNTIVEKTYPEPWNYYFASISCSKSPVLSSQNLLHIFWIENDAPPPPLPLFQKFTDLEAGSFPFLIVILYLRLRGGWDWGWVVGETHDQWSLITKEVAHFHYHSLSSSASWAQYTCAMRGAWKAKWQVSTCSSPLSGQHKATH